MTLDRKTLREIADAAALQMRDERTDPLMHTYLKILRERAEVLEELLALLAWWTRPARERRYNPGVASVDVGAYRRKDGRMVRGYKRRAR